MRDLDLLRTLDGCNWAPPAHTVAAWQGLPVAHGFGGTREGSPKDGKSVRQVHGTTILKADPGTDLTTTPADGLITTVAGVCLAVKTADCLPVLFADRRGRFAAAVHAGWRGLTAGILARALEWADRSGAPRSDLVAAIGPAIGRERFEVGFEVVEALSGPALGLSSQAFSLCVAKGKGDRWHIDLQLAAALALLAESLAPEAVSIVQASTFDDTRWHSYRREGPGVLSNWSWIRLTAKP